MVSLFGGAWEVVVWGGGIETGEWAVRCARECVCKRDQEEMLDGNTG